MEMFSNWMFWVAIIVVISLFALIGYISENNRKKKEKNSSYEKPILPSNSEDLNSNVSEPVDDNSTLNLDNGTWNDNSQDNNVQNIGVDSFESPYSAVNEEIQNDVEQTDSLDGGSAFENSDQSDVFNEVVETPAESTLESTEVSEVPSAESTEVSEEPSAESTEVSEVSSAEATEVSEEPSAEATEVSEVPSAESTEVSGDSSSEIWKM